MTFLCLSLLITVVAASPSKHRPGVDGLKGSSLASIWIDVDEDESLEESLDDESLHDETSGLLTQKRFLAQHGLAEEMEAPVNRSSKEGKNLLAQKKISPAKVEREKVAQRKFSAPYRTATKKGEPEEIEVYNEGDGSYGKYADLIVSSSPHLEKSQTPQKTETSAEAMAQSFLQMVNDPIEVAKNMARKADYEDQMLATIAKLKEDLEKEMAAAENSSTSLLETGPEPASTLQEKSEETYDKASASAEAAAAKAARFVDMVKDSQVRVRMEKDPKMPEMIGDLLEDLKAEPIVYDNFIHHPLLHNLMQIRQNKLLVKEMGEMTAKARAAHSESQKVTKEQVGMEHYIHAKYGIHKGIDISPTLMVIVVAAAAITFMFGVYALKDKSDKEKNFYMAFVNGSGLSTSSSDITSSETGSTDRELKNRMERFEQRLEDHKRKLELEGQQVDRSTTDSSSLEDNKKKPAWMRKR